MELKEFANNIYPLPQASANLLLKAFSMMRLPKGNHLLRERSKSDKLYIIKEGIAYAYANMNGKYVTFWIGQEGAVIYPVHTLHYGSSEYCTVELLEDSVLYEIDIEQLNTLYQQDVNLANWGRMLVERECMKLEKTVIARQFKTVQERYADLFNEAPGIIRRTPVNIIASYLNTTSENLSRIRRKIITK